MSITENGPYSAKDYSQTTVTRASRNRKIHFRVMRLETYQHNNIKNNI